MLFVLIYSSCFLMKFQALTKIVVLRQPLPRPFSISNGPSHTLAAPFYISLIDRSLISFALLPCCCMLLCMNRLSDVHGRPPAAASCSLSRSDPMVRQRGHMNTGQAHAARCFCRSPALSLSRWLQECAEDGGRSQAFASRREGKEWSAPVCPAWKACAGGPSLTPCCSGARYCTCADMPQAHCSDCGVSISLHHGLHQCSVCHERRRLHARNGQAASAAAAVPAPAAPSPPPRLFHRDETSHGNLSHDQRVAITVLHGEGHDESYIASRIPCDVRSV